MRGALGLPLLAACGASAPLEWTAVSFNSGTTLGLPHEASLADGYGARQAELSDQWYGNGLSWSAVIDDVARSLRALSADVVGFQEIFHPEECASIPAEARAGFVCETWAPGDPTVVQRVMGPDYRVACHRGHPDKCLAVKKSFGRVVGCDADLCLDALDGAPIDGCGRGARVGRARLEREDGLILTVVNVHGSSGFDARDTDCRTKQLAQVFRSIDGGAAAADGEHNLVLGDFNVDPVRLAGEASADAMLLMVRERGFHFVSAIGEDALPTYAGLVNIDHMMADTTSGRCHALGITAGTSSVTRVTYFDHAPLVCALSTAR